MEAVPGAAVAPVFPSVVAYCGQGGGHGAGLPSAVAYRGQGSGQARAGVAPVSGW
ncbi:MAG TPA: hypothetical protein VGR20_12885 [Acidimicrobiia bacterium]|nr:hypothetical protein [Acidimicrobiia bacterium]